MNEPITDATKLSSISGLPRPPFYCIRAHRLAAALPDPEEALREPNGLLAAGGDLVASTLIEAYRRGIFPWYSEAQSILWWSPDPRAVIRPRELHVSRSLQRTLRRNRITASCDRAFRAVVAACAAPRRGQRGTWITGAMAAAYADLHRRGHAHSIECWQDERLVGGIYGVAIGRVFFGESMFSRVTDASKVALVALSRRLVAWGFELIDCQIEHPHLKSLGAVAMPRRDFSALIARLCEQPVCAAAWQDAPP